MHDGKVREDITIKPYEESKASLHEYKNISFLNKIRLGVRNTFNLPMKFILLLMVFLLITFAFPSFAPTMSMAASVISMIMRAIFFNSFFTRNKFIFR